MTGIGQYLKETRAELNHVAWPTRSQTVIYTILVALMSVGIAAYLGIFDYIFTTGLSRGLATLPTAPVTVSHSPATSTAATTTNK